MEVKRKLGITIIFLLICLVLLFAASYAWIAMSMAPEVTSIETNVGANGSLEIALLSDETYIDLAKIRAKAGDSALVQNAVISNQAWGNVIELADESYGMQEVTMFPARLNLSGGEEDVYSVSNNMLMTANIGFDGRIGQMEAETVSAIYDSDGFVYYGDQQHYGVRAIGTVSGITRQQAAITNARTAIRAYTTSALNTTQSVWEIHGPAMTDILFARYVSGTQIFGKEDVATIENAARGAQSALNYVDLGLRQGIVGFAASQIGEEEEFEKICNMITNTSVPLSAVVEAVGSKIPGSIKTWILQLDEMKADVQYVITACNALSEEPEWSELEPLLDILVDAECTYLGEYRLFSQESIDNLKEDNVLTLPPDSGVMAKIAAYTGNYSAYYTWRGSIKVQVITADPNDVPYLVQISELVNNMEPATGGGAQAEALRDIYGFAVDMAFRCNTSCELQLQTAAALRMGEVSGTDAIQGGGSYMRFDSENMDLEQLLALMDTIRVGFLNDRSELIAVAKLNTDAYDEQEEGVAAPLYLYDYCVLENKSIQVLQQRGEDSGILSLTANTPEILSAVVWLDGDYVNNSMVGYTSAQSMNGILNLQFSSSASLNPLDLPVKDRN